MGKENENSGYRKIDIMGIVNITDDSFYPASRCLDKEGKADIGKVLDRIGEMQKHGASIIDIGACSTRPGSASVSEEEEWERLHPVLEAVRENYPDTTISIDTFRSGIIRKAAGIIRLDNLIVNDISAGEADPEMLCTAAELGLVYIAMHMRGTPATMQQMCDYDDVTESILDYFKKFAERADAAGIREWILDPGFGFAKTIGQNYRLLADLERFSGPEMPVCKNGKKMRILVGVSRKSMIYKMFGITPDESLAQTQVLHLAALERGASILRVHDVAEAARTVQIYRLLHQTR